MNLLPELAGHDDAVCSCGKRHRIQTQTIRVGTDALKELPEALNVCGFRGRGLVISDANTCRAAGAEAARLLTGSGFDFQEFRFSGENVHADAAHLRELTDAAAKHGPSWMLAVGSGSINDLVKTAAHRSGIPYGVIATAASMDGYLSANAAIFENGIKKQYLNLTPPLAVIADSGILRSAPAGMTRAGLGDALGKLTSLTEWKLNHLLAEEFYCPIAAGLVEREVLALLAAADRADESSPAFFDALIRTLLVTGISMQMLGNSTPASAGEHYFSHALDTYGCAVRGNICASHGDQVALGTWKLLRLYEKLPVSFRPDRERYTRHISDWRKLGVELDETITGKMQNLKALTADLSTVFSSFELQSAVRAMLAHRPAIERVYRKFHLPVCAGMLGIPEEEAAFAWEHAVDMRKRFSLMDFMPGSETDVNPDRAQENNEDRHRRKETDDDRPE